MNGQTFAKLQTLIHEQVGIRLDDRQEMVTSRLRRVARAAGFDDVDDYITRVLANPSPERLSEVVDRLSTNHTFFHREAKHFEQLADVLQPLVAQRRQQGVRDIRLWCAAASFGQEPYQLAMILREVIGPEVSKWKAGLLATDISSDALATAKAGIYEEEDVAKLPPARQRWFLKTKDGKRKVRPELQRDVTYRRLNLVTGPFSFRVPFDIIFCRNVMIYFDLDVRTRLVHHLAQVLQPGGHLFISLSETLPQDRSLPFTYVSPGLYRRNAY